MCVHVCSKNLLCVSCNMQQQVWRDCGMVQQTGPGQAIEHIECFWYLFKSPPLSLSLSLYMCKDALPKNTPEQVAGS